MNQGRIWCVVHPTVGLPLFLGSVALTSLAVHASVMTNTTWMSSYWQGAKAKTASVLPATGTAALASAPGFAVTVTPVATATGETSFVVKVVANPALDPATADPATAAADPARTPGPLALAAPPPN
jgi:light-harvesting protein B-800-850 alpha chain